MNWPAVDHVNGAGSEGDPFVPNSSEQSVHFRKRGAQEERRTLRKSGDVGTAGAVLGGIAVPNAGYFPETRPFSSAAQKRKHDWPKKKRDDDMKGKNEPLIKCSKMTKRGEENGQIA